MIQESLILRHSVEFYGVQYSRVLRNAGIRCIQELGRPFAPQVLRRQPQLSLQHCSFPRNLAPPFRVRSWQNGRGHTRESAGHTITGGGNTITGVGHTITGGGGGHKVDETSAMASARPRSCPQRVHQSTLEFFRRLSNARMFCRIVQKVPPS